LFYSESNTQRLQNNKLENTGNINGNKIQAVGRVCEERLRKRDYL
jgi:hypothetical protein